MRPAFTAALIAASAPAIPAHAATSLVNNGSFETWDFSGWTLQGHKDTIYVSDQEVGGGPTHGKFHAVAGQDGYSRLSQSTRTVAGAKYTVGFDFANPGLGENAFAFFFDGALIEARIDQPS